MNAIKIWFKKFLGLPKGYVLVRGRYVRNGEGEDIGWTLEYLREMCADNDGTLYGSYTSNVEEACLFDTREDALKFKTYHKDTLMGFINVCGVLYE